MRSQTFVRILFFAALCAAANAAITVVSLNATSVMAASGRTRGSLNSVNVQDQTANEDNGNNYLELTKTFSGKHCI